MTQTEEIERLKLEVENLKLRIQLMELQLNSNNITSYPSVWGTTDSGTPKDFRLWDITYTDSTSVKEEV